MRNAQTLSSLPFGQPAPQIDAGAKTPWYVTRCLRGRGTSAQRRSINTSCVITTAVVPSRQSLFSTYPILPPPGSTSRDSATAGRPA
jgi:hypothetical protein